MSKQNPTFVYERELLLKGFRMIVGVDEAGCGALAGPVCAGAVVLPLDSRLGKLRDSKLLLPKMREELCELIKERATAWAVGIATVEEIEELNIRRATYLAMRRAVQQIQDADVLLVDAWKIPDVDLPQFNIVRGDFKIKSIAAASIIAKVTRDRLMREYHKMYPFYRFDIHKGYATALHRKMITSCGPCPIHRLTYKTFGLTKT